MIKTSRNNSNLSQSLCIAAAALMIASFSISANASDSVAGAKQETFASPEQAVDALAAAWHRGNNSALLKIFGPGGIKLVSSGDVIAEKEARDRLASEYDAQHRIEKKSENKALLIIGTDEFPYPIPVVKVADAWKFDTRAGEEEILDRRIGRNELNVIEVGRTFVEAQREYASRDPLGNGLHEYAQKIVSANDKRDGLYWQTKEEEDESPLGPFIASAAAEGYGHASASMQAPYHGYYYKILTRQGASASGGASDYVVNGHMTGGFAMVAFPAKYGDSGVMTFIVNQHGIVFEKNLGSHTAKIAKDMTEYNPDPTWKTP